MLWAQAEELRDAQMFDETVASWVTVLLNIEHVHGPIALFLWAHGQEVRDA